MFVAGDPVPFVFVVMAVVVVVVVVVAVLVAVHGRDGHGLANISLFSNAPYGSYLFEPSSGNSVYT